MDLPTEIIHLIASALAHAHAPGSDGIWFKLTLFHRPFRDYAYSERGRAEFIRLFTQITTVDEGPYSVTTYRLLGRKHRTDGPAVIKTAIDLFEVDVELDGVPLIHKYYQNGCYYRPDDRPTVEKFGFDGNLSVEIWRSGVSSKKHREDDLPAVITYDGDKIVYKVWFLHGEIHRIHGPAIQMYDVGECLISQSYYHFGKYVSK